MTDNNKASRPPEIIRRLMPSILIPGQERRKQKMSAQWIYERLVEAIIDFEEQLDEEQEVGAKLVSFNQTETFNIIDMGFWDPDLIIFFGITPDGKQVQLIQHISQVNIMLMEMPKPKEKPARRIGFVLEKKIPNKNKRNKAGRKTKAEK